MPKNSISNHKHTAEKLWKRELKRYSHVEKVGEWEQDGMNIFHKVFYVSGLRHKFVVTFYTADEVESVISGTFKSVL